MSTPKKRSASRVKVYTERSPRRLDALLRTFPALLERSIIEPWNARLRRKVKEYARMIAAERALEQQETLPFDIEPGLLAAESLVSP